MENVITTTFDHPSDAMQFLGLRNTRKEFNRFTGIVYFEGTVINVKGKQCHYDLVKEVFVVEEFEA